MLYLENEIDAEHIKELEVLQSKLRQPLPKLLTRVLEVSQDDGIPEVFSADEEYVNPAFKAFMESGLIGCMHGDGNLSVDYKKHLWTDKK